MTRGYNARHAAPPRVVTPRPADWIAALERGERLGRAALEADGAQLGSELVQFRLVVKDLTAESFPVPAPVARLVAGAFLNAGRAFAHIDAAPEARTACAALLVEATRLTDSLWTVHRTAQAQNSWGRHGGGGDA